MQLKSLVAAAQKQFGEMQFDVDEFSLSLRYVQDLEARLADNLAGKEFRSLRMDFANCIRRDLAHSHTYSQIANNTPFAQYPLIDKDTLRQSPETVFNPAFVNEPLWCKATSGTTGPPVNVIYEAGFYFDQLLQTTARILKRSGRCIDPDRFHCVALTDNQSCRACLWIHPAGVVGPSLQIVVSDTSTDDLGHILEWLRSFRPECITLKPSILEFLLQDANAIDLLSRSADVLICSGANLATELREKARAAVSIPIVQAYGLTEFGIVASECEFGNLHIDGNIHAETIDPETHSPTRGFGELVLSSSRNRAFPLLRYRTGDLARIFATQCPCGCPSKVIKELSGRLMLSFKLPSGRLLSPARFNRLFEAFMLREFQLTQVDHNRFHISIEGTRDLHPDIMLEVQDEVRKLIGEPCVVTATIENFSRTKKFERYRRLSW